MNQEGGKYEFYKMDSGHNGNCDIYCYNYFNRQGKTNPLGLWYSNNRPDHLFGRYDILLQKENEMKLLKDVLNVLKSFGVLFLLVIVTLFFISKLSDKNSEVDRLKKDKKKLEYKIDTRGVELLKKEKAVEKLKGELDLRGEKIKELIKQSPAVKVITKIKEVIKEDPELTAEFSSLEDYIKVLESRVKFYLDLEKLYEKNKNSIQAGYKKQIEDLKIGWELQEKILKHSRPDRFAFFLYGELIKVQGVYFTNPGAEVEVNFKKTRVSLYIKYNSVTGKTGFVTGVKIGLKIFKF